MKLDEKLARLLGDTSLADIMSEKMRDAMKEIERGHTLSFFFKICSILDS